MRKFMIVTSFFILWWVCGVVNVGFNNAYDRHMYCDSHGIRSDQLMLNMNNTFSMLVGPVGLMISLPPAGSGVTDFPSMSIAR